jgi:hypothetical protein
MESVFDKFHMTKFWGPQLVDSIAFSMKTGLTNQYPQYINGASAKYDYCKELIKVLVLVIRKV